MCKGAVYGSDSKPVEIKDIVTGAGQSKTLNSKPKLFFIQACRGDNPGSQPIERTLSDDVSAPVYADIYISYPTISGDKAYRGERRGSWFIVELCRILCEKAQVKSLSDIQKEVNQAMGKYSHRGYMVHPTGSDQLHKRVHFFLK